MSFAKKIEFGNYTVKFGESKALLDEFDSIVMPSFFEMKYIRKIKGKGEYFFIDTKLVKLSSDNEAPVLGIAGRIVKNTKLKRDQIFRRDGGLIEDQMELETAPSSTFLLILNNHRLMFCREVSGAPTVQNFQSTSQYCLTQRHREFIQEKFDKAKTERESDSSLERVTKVKLLAELPFPQLRITPLAGKQDLKEFIARFNNIEELSIKLLPTNKEEIDNDDFWVGFGARREQLNSSAATAKFSNPKEGLDAEAVYSQTSAATNFGNSEIKLKGSDIYGDTLKGSNEDFSLFVEVDELPKNVELAATEKYGQFIKLVQAGVISLPSVTGEVINKIKSIFSRL